MDRSATLVIRADLVEIEKVTTALEIAMRACAFTDDLIRELQLAVEEAIANTIIHGYRGAAGDVAIAICVTPGAVEVRIEDRAPPFDPLGFPEPDRESSLDERRIGGLGIFLIRQAVDEAVYQYAEDKNILLLVKRRPA
jgi:anti-sigma regulatory factor (Ser/Thr protein kinase)